MSDWRTPLGEWVMGNGKNLSFQFAITIRNYQFAITNSQLPIVQRLVKSGSDWRIGWNPNAPEFNGLVGTDDWAIELTEAELNDFCRLLAQLADTMKQLASELMDEEKIACEAESDLLWMEVEGYPHAYSLRFILNTGRCVEGKWNADAVAGLLQAAATLKVF